MIILQQAVADSAQRALDKHYVEILEKTNHQLSAGWWTPFGVTVAWLTALLTLGGIAAAYLLYRQSQDYQKKLEALFARFGEMISQKESEAEAQIAAIELNNKLAGERFEELMHSVRKSAEQTTGEAKEKLLTVLQDLEKAKESATGDFQRFLFTPAARKRMEERLRPGRPMRTTQAFPDPREGPDQRWYWICPWCAQVNGPDERYPTNRLKARRCDRCDRKTGVSYPPEILPDTKQ